MGRADRHRSLEASHGGRGKKRLTAFFLFLSEQEGADAPYEWLVSLVCEEFNCLPSAARRELDHDPDHMALQIMSMRAFARTKAAYDQDGDKAKVPNAALLALVKEIDFGIVTERLAREVG